MGNGFFYNNRTILIKNIKWAQPYKKYMSLWGQLKCHPNPDSNPGHPRAKPTCNQLYHNGTRKYSHIKPLSLSKNNDNFFEMSPQPGFEPGSPARKANVQPTIP